MSSPVPGWIEARVEGLSFCDVGGIGVGAINERISIALGAGAAEATMIDLRPAEYPEWMNFRKRMEERGVQEYKTIDKANLEAADFADQVGVYDFVHSTGILYHAPSPVVIMDNLRRIARRYLITSTVIIPERIETEFGSLDYPGSQAVFLPGISERERAILRADMSSKLNWPKGRFDSCVPRPEDPAAAMPYIQNRAPSDLHFWRSEGDLSYSPYWWLFTKDAFRALVRMFGLQIIDEHVYKDHALTVLCERGTPRSNGDRYQSASAGEHHSGTPSAPPPDLGNRAEGTDVTAPARTRSADSAAGARPQPGEFGGWGARVGGKAEEVGDVEQVTEHEILPWYHNFEWPDGTLTSGHKTSNSTVVRHIFGGVDCSNRNGVDLGCMDGFFAVVMKRRGANAVVAFDRKDRTGNIEVVRENLGVDFTYRPRVHMDQVRPVLLEQFGGLADVVNFSGMLYHMMDPFRGIGLVRGMVRRGGIVVLDTPALVSNDFFLYYNHDQKLYGYTSYFAPTVAALQAMCEYMGLEVLDAVQTQQGRTMGLPLVRICLALRATDIPIFHDPSVPQWVPKYSVDDFIEMMSPDQWSSRDDAAVTYTPTRGVGYAHVRHTMSLAEYSQESEPLRFQEADIVLRPSDMH